MSKTYRTTLQVRGYELDSFGHVNHAVYFSYLEHARWEVFAENKIGLDELNEMKTWPIIASITDAKYIRPLYMGDFLEVRSTLLETKGSRFVIGHEILRKDEVVFMAKVHVVMVNASGKPVEAPDRIKAMWVTSSLGAAD